MSGLSDASLLRQGYHNNDALTANRNFRPSNYSSTRSTSITVASETIPSGALLVKLTNLSYVAGEHIKYAFGISSADAANNLAVGECILLTGVSEVIGIPDNAAGFAYVSATGVPLLGITYGA